MNRRLIKTVVLVFMVALLAVGMLSGCAEKDKSTIYVALQIPYSGAWAEGYEKLDASTKALIKYINEEDPIPGVTLELLTYDTQSGTDYALTGYEYLVGQGAKYIACTDSGTIMVIKSKANTDKVPVFLSGPVTAATSPPGYAFCAPMSYYNQTLPLLRYIADLSTPTSRPTIGFFGYSDMSYGSDRLDAIEDYYAANTTKLNYLGAQTFSMFSMPGAYSTEVNALKDCDYIFLGATSTHAAPFMSAMRDGGYSPKYCILGSDTGFMETYLTNPGEDALNGTLWATDLGYWRTSDDELNVLVRKLVEEYYDADSKAELEAGYLAGLSTSVFVVLSGIEILREAVKDLDDPTDVTGEMIFNTAETYQFEYDGLPTMGFTNTKRSLLDDVEVWEFRSSDSDWHQVSE